MKRFLTILSIFLCCHGTSLYAQEKKLSVAIILPLAHQALDDIAAGFQDELRQQLPDHQITYTRFNAQADPNLEHTMLAQIKRQDFDLVVPLTTTTTLKARRIIQNKPIVSLAAMYSEAERKASKNLTGILDEFPIEAPFQFLQELKPELKKIYVIHSPNDHVVDDIEKLKKQAQKTGVTVQPMLMQNLTDLYALAHHLPQDADVIMVMKDNLVASGIGVLIPLARKQKKLLFTLDEGTVKEGAPLGLGVKERQIGEKGARLAAKVVNGTPIADLPVEKMTDLTLFYHPTSLNHTAVDLKLLKGLVKKKGYTLQAFEKNCPSTSGAPS